ncbi:MAG TPA: adenylate/guanylate cyclase domain-containing protein, partial [Anaerolineae bacterium]
MEPLSAYLPLDRQRALVTGEPLPDRSTGAVLFADISGFTPLTAALEQELGARRGAEEVTGQLNRVFSAVIEQVDKFGGSVVNFSGDAITCWFDEKDEASSLTPALALRASAGASVPHPSSLRATACALAMQTAMRPFATVRTPAGTPIELAIKVSAVAGTVRRFLVGDPNIHQMEVLAGRVLDKLGVVDYLVRKGEVLVAADVASHLAARLTVAEWREDEQTRERYAVVTALEGPVPQAAWPVQRLDDEIARPWLLPPVYERLHSGQGQFLSELRPAAALFLEFSGIDYDDDDAAGEKLDAFICWVQNVIARYEGFLLQLSIGEKGSYLYASFGAPIAHEDDAERAIAAALDLITLPARLGFIRNVRIGLSRGQMRTGAYGGPTRRTYGVMGSEANIACRLMQNARPRTILASERILAGQPEFDLEAAGRMPLKGVAEPVPVSYVRGRRRERSTTVVASAP